MKFGARLTALAALVVTVLSSATSSGISAASVQVTGAQDARPTVAANVGVKIATKDLLSNPTALVNKNTVAMDNNVFIARSNLLFSQNDRLGVMRAIEEFVEQAEPSSSTAVLSKNILKAISAPDTDATMMSKASAVVASKGSPAAIQRAIVDLMLTVSDRMALTSKIEALLLSGSSDNEPMSTAVLSKNILKAISAPDTDAAMMSKASAVVAAKGDTSALQRSIADLLATKERMTQAQTPSGVTLLMGTEDVLRQPASDNSPMSTTEDKYRMGFLYTKASGNDDKEQFGLWGAGLGFGWRYPLGYWNLYGRGFYGGGCGLGFGFGGFFYC